MTEAELARKRAKIGKLCDEYAHRVAQLQETLLEVASEIGDLQKSGTYGIQLALEISPRLTQIHYDFVAAMIFVDAARPTN